MSLFEASSHSLVTPSPGANNLAALPTTVLIEYGHLKPPPDLNAASLISSPLFREIYGVYRSCFPHGAQPPQFFAEMFAFNRDPSMQKQWGPASYEIAIARHEEKIVGVGMSCVIVAPPGGWADSRYLGAVGMDYRAVLPDWRGYGIAGRFERMAMDRASTMAQRAHRMDKAPVFVFNEMASPLTMPFRNFADDVEKAETHAFDRVGIWNKAGLLRVLPSPGVDFYVDPPNPWFSFQVKLKDEKWIGARTVEDIVLRYNALCGTHGHDPRDADPNFKIMFAQLQWQNLLPRIADAESLKILRGASDQLLDWHRGYIPAAIGERSVGTLIRENFPQDWAAYGRLTKNAA